VTNLTREKIARELDTRGPESCMEETLQELSENNPEVLDMATRCAASFGDRYQKIMLELCIFYRLLVAEFKAIDPALRLLNPFPRVTRQTRNELVRQIDEQGLEAFTTNATKHLAQYNPELLQMAHNSAERHKSYLPMIQGFALLYQALVEQAAAGTVSATLH
jgi:hypothetical protein